MLQLVLKTEPEWVGKKGCPRTACGSLRHRRMESFWGDWAPGLCTALVLQGMRKEVMRKETCTGAEEQRKGSGGDDRAVCSFRNGTQVPGNVWDTKKLSSHRRGRRPSEFRQKERWWLSQGGA